METVPRASAQTQSTDHADSARPEDDWPPECDAYDARVHEFLTWAAEAVERHRNGSRADLLDETRGKALGHAIDLFGAYKALSDAKINVGDDGVFRRLIWSRPPDPD